MFTPPSPNSNVLEWRAYFVWSSQPDEVHFLNYHLYHLCWDSGQSRSLVAIQFCQELSFRFWVKVGEPERGDQVERPHEPHSVGLGAGDEVHLFEGSQYGHAQLKDNCLRARDTNRSFAHPTKGETATKTQSM